MSTVQELIKNLYDFWQEHGCVRHDGHDLEMGAGTFNPATFLRSFGPEPYSAAYVEPSRRPGDGRYGENPNRVQKHHQFQVIIKPSPEDIQDLYLQSLEKIGFDLSQHDVRFVHDDWESPTLGAWGLGWEVWLNGMEITQFTYFQCVGGIPLRPIPVELTIGIERLAMYLQDVDSVYDLKWNDKLTYGDIFKADEVQWSTYNFEAADPEMWARHFEDYEREAGFLMEKGLPLPAYDFVIKASHAFNMLEARGVISVTERTGYIGRIRDLSRAIGESYIASRESLHFPLGQAEMPVPAKAPEWKQETRDPLEREDFLLEVGCEELPATFVDPACRELKKQLLNFFKGQNLDHGEVHVFGSPRRIAVLVKDLAVGTKAKAERRRGPPLSRCFELDGKVSSTGQGYFSALGIENPTLKEALRGELPGIEIDEFKKTDYVFSTIHTPSLPAGGLLAEALPQIILNISFPKSMRWGNWDTTFARPIRWLVALLGSEVVPFAIGPIISGRVSWGHRQLSGKSVEISHPDQYLDSLRKEHVMADGNERRESILNQLAQWEQEHGLKVLEKERVLKQVANLVEWPFICSSQFDTAFLEAPPEVLISEMVEHQKIFPVSGKNEVGLSNHFIITANNRPTDLIIRGNNKVISARLADGVFLCKQDLQCRLEDFNEKLKKVTHQKDLGSVYDKVQRIVAFTQILAKHLRMKDADKAIRAAELCKADLASELVGEFPELQGTIGRYYALRQGEDETVAQAIDEHWMPRGEDAPLPRSMEGTLLALADKIDNLLGCFRVGLRPTSSSDPYALRRQVLGIIRILIRQELFLPLRAVLNQCNDVFEGKNTKVVSELLRFIGKRVPTVFQSYDLAHDEIDASLSEEPSDIFQVFLKIQALHQFRNAGPDFGKLLEVYKRARGQIAGQGKMDFSEDKLEEGAEMALYNSLRMSQPMLEELLATRQYHEAYCLLSNLQAPLATFFDEVKVMVDQKSLRNNRIALLQKVFNMFEQLVDFDKIVDEKKAACAASGK